MKNLKLITVSAFIAAGSLFFTSCGGGDTKETEKEEKVAKSGTSEVSVILKDLESGKIKLGETSASDLAKKYDLEEDEYQMEDEQEFKGYRFERNFSIEDDKVYYMSFHTYSEGDDYDPIKEDVKNVVAELKSIFGEPDSDTGNSYEWATDEYTVKLNTYSTSGYDINVDQVTDLSDNEGSCVGDFYGLKNDLKDIFLSNIKSGAIALGKTTKSEMAALAGDESSFTKEYEGLRVSGYFSYDGDKLSSISLDYFYDCEGALNLLDLDKSGITSTVDETLGVTGEKNGDYEDAGVTWDLGGQKVSQSNFSDGYGIYLNK